MSLQTILLRMIYAWGDAVPYEWGEEVDKLIGWYVGGVQAGALDLCEELHNAAIKQGSV